MVGLNFGNGVPDHSSQLPRGFKPFDVTEGDGTIDLIVNGRPRALRKRLRIIRYISPDQNELLPIIDVVGECTGRDRVYIPCDGAVEMAHIIDLLESASSKRELRARERDQRIAHRTKEVREQGIEYAQRMMLNKARRSVFGPGINVQRGN